MTPYNIRKLLPLQEAHNPSLISSNNNNHTLSPLKSSNSEIHTNYSSPTPPSCCYNDLKLSPPFDSAMALTVLILLTALFFMGFFSIYIRRFAEDSSSSDPTTRNRRSSDNTTSRTRSAYRMASAAKGVDPTTVKSLPVHAYCGGGAKQGIEEVECAICLSEFEEREWVKEIPYCGHVFHVECIDTWLESHVTCPLCRTAKLLVEGHVEDKEEEEGGEVGVGEVALVVEGGDTWNNVEMEDREVGPMRGGGERRSTSCLWCGGDRLSLNRSLSF